ncbi:hypothetical protein ACFXTI_009997 [Malus domestica]
MAEAAAAAEDTKSSAHHHHKESSSTPPWSSRLPLRLELAKEYDVELDVVLTILGYVYSEKLRLLPKAFASAWMTLALMSLVDRWLISWWRFCMFLQLFKSPN